jgi:hypothetical protein
VQHDDVVARLDDREVKFRVQPRLVRRIALLVRDLHLAEDRVDDRQVGIRSQPRGAFRGQPLHVAAKADVVEHGLVMGGEQSTSAGENAEPSTSAT